MATSAHHRELTGPPLVAAARGALTAAGEQWTDMRGAVFSALAAHERPASAYDIAESSATIDASELRAAADRSERVW